ncbi:MAG: hypothetical protein ACI4Q6_04570, partial [Huintestinicola sp.]
MTVRKTLLSRMTAILSAVLIAVLVMLVFPESNPKVGALDEIDASTIVDGSYEYSFVVSGKTIACAPGTAPDTIDKIKTGDPVKFNLNKMNINNSAAVADQWYCLGLDCKNFMLTSVSEADLMEGSTVIGRFYIQNSKFYFKLNSTFLAAEHLWVEGHFDGEVCLDEDDINAGTANLEEGLTGIYVPNIPVEGTRAMTVSKSLAGGLSVSADGTAVQQYQAVIESTGNIGTSITVADAMKNAGLGAVLDGNIAVTSNKEGTAFASSYADFSAISGIIKPGERLTLTYSMKLNNFKDVYSAASRPADWKDNEIKVSYDDNGVTKEETANVSFAVNDPSLFKSHGTLSEDKSKFSWTVTIYCPFFTGNKTVDSAYVTDLKDSYSVNDGAAVDVPVSFDSAVWNIYNKNYTITYTTPVDNTSAVDLSIKNTVEAKIFGKPFSSDGWGSFTADNPIVKTKTDPAVDTENGSMGWKVEYTVPADNVTDLVINDSTWASNGHSHAVDTSTVTVTKNGAAFTDCTVEAGGNVRINNGSYAKNDVFVITYKTVTSTAKEGDANEVFADSEFENTARAVY